MQAGKLRHLITFQRRTDTQDNYGAPVPSWAALTPKSWADIMPLSGREAEFGKSIAATVSHRIEIRFRSDLILADKIIFGSRAFAINAIIDPEERGRKQYLYCSETAA